MKKLFQRLACVMLVCASIYAQEKEQEKPLLTIEKIENGKIVIQEPISFFLCNDAVTYLVRNESADKGSRITRLAGGKFWGITPEKVHLNHQEQVNPLYGASIDFLAFGKDNNLCIVANNDPATIYMVTGVMPTNIRMISAKGIKDTDGNTINGIVGLVHGTVSTVTHEKKIVDKKEIQEKKVRLDNYTFVAVKNAAGAFGATGSGIAVLRYDADEKEEKEDKNKKETDEEKKKKEEERKAKAKPFFDIVDANTGISKGNKPYPINNATPAIALRDGVEYVGNAADMYWDLSTQSCYIALQIKTKYDAREDQGGCALLVARVEKGALVVDPVVPHEALHADASIIGATGADRYVSLHKVRTMQTASGLTYLIVVGGNGKPEETANSVYALPVARAEEAEAHLKGALAKKGAPVKHTFSKNNVLTARSYKQYATQQGDCYTHDDDAVRVGGKSVLPGPIVDIAINGDCVIVGVKQDGNGKAAGAFYSQAIIDEHGAVAAWTPWQRVVGSEKKVLHVMPGVAQCRFIHEENSHFTDETTAWHKTAVIALGDTKAKMAYDPQQACIEALFPRHDIFGITDYPLHTPGVSGNEKLSIMAFMGVGTVALMQTSETDAQGVVRSVCDYGQSSDRFTHYASPVLEECGTLTCSALGVHNNNAWLFVGGTQGVAVLAQDNGAGWDASVGLGNGFNALRNGFTFKKLGAHKLVRKLACCDGYLYILTNTSLERIPLHRDQWNIQSQPEVLVTRNTDNKNIVFNDMLIGDNLLLVATSQGLYRFDAGHRMEKIDLPHQEPLSVTQLFAISANEQSFDHKSNVYVVARSASYRETYVYRLFIDKTRGNEHVTLIEDSANNSKKSHYWLRFAAPQQGCLTDGVTVYNYCSRLNQQAPHVSFMAAPRLHNKSVYRIQESNQLPLGIHDAHAVHAMVRNSATGSWLVAGDFGLRVNK